MIRALRRTRLASLFAAIALFATMPVTVSSLLHNDEDDTRCNPAAVVHDVTAHHVGATGTALPESDHCILCHALQSLRAIDTAVRFAPPSVDTRLVASASTSVFDDLVVSSTPARAPPLA